MITVKANCETLMNLDTAGLKDISKAVTEVCSAMREKMFIKALEGWTGWDSQDADWTGNILPAQIQKSYVKALEGDLARRISSTR